jgi:hypothetical protein
MQRVAAQQNIEISRLKALVRVGVATRKENEAGYGHGHGGEQRDGGGVIMSAENVRQLRENLERERQVRGRVNFSMKDRGNGY